MQIKIMFLLFTQKRATVVYDQLCERMRSAWCWPTATGFYIQRDNAALLSAWPAHTAARTSSDCDRLGCVSDE